MRLPEKIQLLLRRDGISQADLARGIDIYPTRISDWIKGKGKPSSTQALRIARFFKVPLEYLVDDALMTPPSPPDLPERAFHDMGRFVGFFDALQWMITHPNILKKIEKDADGRRLILPNGMIYYPQIGTLMDGPYDDPEDIPNADEMKQEYDSEMERYADQLAGEDPDVGAGTAERIGVEGLIEILENRKPKAILPPRESHADTAGSDTAKEEEDSA